MKVVAIIQARMGSTRLPGKVLADIGGASMLARVVHRTRRAATVTEVLVATTMGAADDLLVEEALRLDTTIFRGSEEDVLSRYYEAASAVCADAIVRITSDCPLIDPTVVDTVVTDFLGTSCDYASNFQVRTFPRGLDTEVFTFAALERAWREAQAPFQRAHVTPYLYQHPELFRLMSVVGAHAYSGYRWTVDTPEDLELARALYARLGNNDAFTWREALAVLEREPQLQALNKMVIQKALHEG